MILLSTAQALYSTEVSEGIAGGRAGGTAVPTSPAVNGVVIGASSVLAARLTRECVFSGEGRGLQNRCGDVRSVPRWVRLPCTPAIDFSFTRRPPSSGQLRAIGRGVAPDMGQGVRS